MSRRSGFCTLLLIAGVLASPSWAQPADADAPVISLRIESRTQVPGPDPATIETVYRLVNDSAKTIVAWDFGCLTVRRDGRGAQGQTGYDAYITYEASRGEPVPESEGLIPPGKSVEQKVSYSDAELKDPEVSKTCAPVVVVFEDTSYEGSAGQAESHFRSRARTAVDAYLGREALERELASSRPLAETLEILSVKLSRPPTDPKGSSLPAQQFSSYRDQLLRGRPISADEVLAGLDFYFDSAMKHLPPAWQEKVLAEVEHREP